MINKDAKIYVAGHNGMVGSAIFRKLIMSGYNNIVTKSSKELDLRNQNDVENFFKREQPEFVFLAAAKVGGIGANMMFPSEFLVDNILIQTNVIKSSFLNNVKKLLFLGSSCIYPKNAPQPLKEDYLLSGFLESTNEGYALAKITGLKMCEYYNKQYGANFVSLMPCNLYGENDNFSLESSHVIPSLIRKFHEAKIKNLPFVEVWGSGNQFREFMYIDDLADASIYTMKNYEEYQFLNVGTGEDLTIKELSELIRSTVGYKGNIRFDKSKPDGMYRKVMDVSKINELGWKAKTSLRDGLDKTYNWYLKSINQEV
ncbi:GDP-L-fucose synthase [Clostridioides sp. ZZV14-6045]|uniref:GDP-L-fucose synthase family protein n=1 Tax=Clostridioides sp. ZZV14-6045 TaxID=2811489 RepID=UPI001D0FF23B|nr:GDP-L-fucose synthase [Clostridioides sp. ZZV14-6045]